MANIATNRRGGTSSSTRYTITLAPRIESDLEAIADELQISKAEAFRRSLSLFRHAIQADDVVLKKRGERDQILLVK